MRRALLVAASIVAMAACGAEESAPPARAPTGVAPDAPDAGRASATPSEDGASDGGAAANADADADADAGASNEARRPAGGRSLPVPSFGATESAKPSDAHAFRLAASLRAMRSARSGAKVLKMLSVIPAVIEAHAKTGVDPFADGEWLLVYGAKAEVPGGNANVVKHDRAEPVVTRALADAGLDAFDAGAGSGAGAGAGAVRGALYGVQDVLLRPRAGVMALVPEDRASDLAAALSKPVDPGVKPGELARIFVAEPSKVAHFLPPDVTKALVVVRAAADGGLDATTEADCVDAAACKALATSLDEQVRRQNTLMVRIVLKNVLAGIAIHAEGAKLKATLHAAPDQVDAALSLMRAQLGLPAEDPGDVKR